MNFTPDKTAFQLDPVVATKAAWSGDVGTGAAYTVGTLVTKPDDYTEMVAAFQARGFTADKAEFLFIDNTGPKQTCAFRGLNAILNAAKGRRVILCHQDVRLIGDGRSHLDSCLADLDQIDPAWGLAGNAGAVAAGQLALRITDPHGSDRTVGTLPARVMSLDENFIVVRRKARLGFSNDLTGFHLYGADICLNADVMGWHSYVINFHLAHLSGGNKDQSFAAMEGAFQQKWSQAFAPRWMQTTCTLMRLTGDAVGQFASRLTTKPYQKITRRLPQASGWTR